MGQEYSVCAVKVHHWLDAEDTTVGQRETARLAEIIVSHIQEIKINCLQIPSYRGWNFSLKHTNYNCLIWLFDICAFGWKTLTVVTNVFKHLNNLYKKNVTDIFLCNANVPIMRSTVLFRNWSYMAQIF